MRIGTHQNEKKNSYAAGHSKDVLTSLNNQVSAFIDELTKLLPSLGGDKEEQADSVKPESSARSEEDDADQAKGENPFLGAFAPIKSNDRQVDSRQSKERGIDNDEVRQNTSQTSFKKQEKEKDSALTDKETQTTHAEKANDIAKEVGTRNRQIAADRSADKNPSAPKSPVQKSGSGEVIAEGVAATSVAGEAAITTAGTAQNGEKTLLPEGATQNQSLTAVQAATAAVLSMQGQVGAASHAVDGVANGEINIESLKKAIDAVTGAGAKTIDAHSSLLNDSGSLTKSGLFEQNTAKLTPALTAKSEEPRTKATTRVSLVQSMERVENALKEVAKSHDGKTISLRLDPPDLGTVKIDVSLRDNALHARMVAENSSVAQALRDRSSELQVQLRRIGLDVDTVSVAVAHDEGLGANADGLQFGSNQQMSEQRAGNEHRSHSALTTESPLAQSVLTGAQQGILDHWVA